ncbi:MAG TPA: calcium/sodium antiporter [Candidatus Scybalousia intestinigallinarum]|nr:calcium/sodium antiporter [Candidatus Scybalousia intestinigallinarum]
MVLEIILLLIGFGLIIKASDILIDCASSIALLCKVPKMLIALTIVSFGTCAPEVAISFNSVAANNGSMALANVIGSCIVNILLIIGIASIVNPIKVKNATVKKELPILFLITIIFFILLMDRMFNPNTPSSFSRSDGAILILSFGIFVYYLVQLLKNKKQDQEGVERKYNLPVALILFVISTIVIVYSSDLIVDNALSLAERLRVSPKIITMIAVVVGTSLPELVMTVTSAKRGEFDLAIGNIVGTNIFNICIVLGLPILIYGDLELVDFNFVDIFVVLLSSFLLYIFARSEKEISKKEGIIMLLVFCCYYIYLFI